jgi:hypothetical protein
MVLDEENTIDLQCHSCLMLFAHLEPTDEAELNAKVHHYE